MSDTLLFTSQKESLIQRDEKSDKNVLIEIKKISDDLNKNISELGTNVTRKIKKEITLIQTTLSNTITKYEKKSSIFDIIIYKDFVDVVNQMEKFISTYNTSIVVGLNLFCSKIQILANRLSSVILLTSKDYPDEKQTQCVAGNMCNNPLPRHREKFSHKKVCSNGVDCDETSPEHFEEFSH